MAKIIVCTDKGEIFETFEYIKHEDFSTNLSKAYMWDEIEDALIRAIHADKICIIKKKSSN